MGHWVRGFIDEKLFKMVRSAMFETGTHWNEVMAQALRLWVADAKKKTSG